MSRVTFASVHGETVAGAFYESVSEYFQYSQFKEMRRLGDALKEAAGHLDDQELAKKYIEIADDRAFQDAITNCYSGPLLSMGRGRVCAAFLEETDNPWLFMIDTDQTFRPEVVEQMVYVAEQAEVQPKLLAGIVWMVTVYPDGTIAKKEPNVYKRIHDPRLNVDWMAKMDAAELESPGLYKVGAVGAGVMLIHRDLLVKMRDEACGGSAHWWHHLPAPSPMGHKVEQVRAVAERLGVDPAILLCDQYGEDTSFCVRAEAVGEGVYVHSEPRFGHAKKTVVYGKDA